MRRAARTDGNHEEIMTGLRALGYSVHSTACLGHGFPDLVVGRWGRTGLLEVKMPGGTLTPDQAEFRANWDGAYIVATSVEEADQQFRSLWA